jgi:hypothetical protein
MSLFISGYVSASENETRDILFVNSYHYGMDWTDGEMEGAYEVLKQSSTPIQIHVEYMDTKRTSDERHFENLSNLFKHKYQDTKFSAIITTDNGNFSISPCRQLKSKKEQKVLDRLFQ